MRLVFGVLAEYMGNLNDGKLVVCGIFDGFSMVVRSENMPVEVPAHTVVARVGAPPVEAGDHTVELRLRDDDGRELFTSNPVPIRIGPGRIGGFEVCHDAGFRLEDLVVPRCGTYTWEVLVDGSMVGEIPFHVTRLAQPATG